MNDERDELRTIPGWDRLEAAGLVTPVEPAVLIRCQAAVHEAAERTSIRSPAQRKKSWRPLLVVPGVSVAAAVVVTLTVVVLESAPIGEERSAQHAAEVPSARPPQVARRSGALPDGAAARSGDCVEEYSLETLPGRDFAFDGTVVAIEQGGAGEADLGYPSVTFQVHNWFRGGDVPTVTLAMPAPFQLRGGDTSSEAGPSYVVGTRLLVSGEPRWDGEPLRDAFAWTCGFTRYYDETTAARWQAALR